MKAGDISNLGLKVANIDSQVLTDNTSQKAETGESFFSYLKGALQEVDDLQKEAAASGQRLALGDEEYLHNTVIAYEKANLALQLTIQVRDKILEAYQEIMRIQM
ncbi:MAG: flagellar hook-basal body complex protein FliE [Deltaproteobacteria bacterium]